MPSTLEPKCYTCGRRPVMVSHSAREFCSERCRDAYLLDFQNWTPDLIARLYIKEGQTPPTSHKTTSDAVLNGRITEQDRWWLYKYAKIIWDKLPINIPPDPDPYDEPTDFST